MKLNLTLRNTGDVWTLNPDRSYVLGSEASCEITLSEISILSRRHVKFSFDDIENHWIVQDLQSTNGTFVDGQRIDRHVIRGRTEISVANEVLLIAEPLRDAYSSPQVTEIRNPSPVSSPSQQASSPPVSTPSSPYAPPIYQPNSQQTSYEGTYGTEVSPSRNIPFPSTMNRAKARGSTFSSKTLTWQQFVSKQVKLTKHPVRKLVAWGSMITGFRNTPWVRYFHGYNPEQSGNCFLDFDGYVLPNFQESASKILTGIENKLSQLREYENTDCRIVKLTDAHLIDSASQNFIGIELFPVSRGGKPDYRRFCVTSYHRVRTYLVVENYGSDLFVSWLTRFEPVPTSWPMILWLTAALLLSIVIFANTSSSNNGIRIDSVVFSFYPILIWLTCYYFLPLTMQYLKILPKKSNAIFICILLFIILFVIVVPTLVLLVQASIIFISIALILVPLLYIIYRLLNFATEEDEEES